jgi:hypothetical protein
MTFAQRRNRLTTHFSERIPVVKRRMTVVAGVAKPCISFTSISIFNIRVLGSFETSVITHQKAVTRRRRPESSVIKLIHSFILQSVLQQIHSLFQSRYSTESDLVPPLSISNILFFPLMSYSSCLRHLPRYPVTSFLPSIFPSITCFRRQFLHKI